MLKDQILKELKNLSNHKIKEFKARKFGIRSDNSWGVYQKDLSVLAKRIGKNTQLGIELFDTNIYDAQLLCAKICRPEEISEELKEPLNNVKIRLLRARKLLAEIITKNTNN